MSETSAPCVYFEHPGRANTARTVALAAERARALRVAHVVVASNTGSTGLLVTRAFSSSAVTVVTHSTGFAGPNQQELGGENRALLEAAGARILTCQHALGGIGRAVRRKFGTYQIDEIIAFTLRTFSHGVKVCCEITLMAADAGYIPAGEEVIAIGGSGGGADSAAVIRAANAQDFFDLRVLELICKPRSW
jgi:hypothetical protein